jgi:hypothetical protein
MVERKILMTEKKENEKEFDYDTYGGGVEYFGRKLK